MSGTASGRNDFYRAFLEVRLLGNGIGCVQRHLVDQLAGIEPWNEDNAARHPVAALGVDPASDFAAPGNHADLRALIEAAGARVFRMHEDPGAGKRLVKL